VAFIVNSASFFVSAIFIGLTRYDDAAAATDLARSITAFLTWSRFAIAATRTSPR
jgi:hypothetical protein